MDLSGIFQWYGWCSSRENTEKLYGKYQNALWSFQAKVILKGHITESKALESMRDSMGEQSGLQDKGRGGGHTE